MQNEIARLEELSLQHFLHCAAYNNKNHEVSMKHIFSTIWPTKQKLLHYHPCKQLQHFPTSMLFLIQVQNAVISSHLRRNLGPINQRSP